MGNNKKMMYFGDYKEEIKKYCDNNGLDFSKVQLISKCGSENFLALQHPDEDGKVGLWEPMPVVLLITREGDKLNFEQTEYTKRYIGK